MLAETARRGLLAARAGSLELKYDGFRAARGARGRQARLLYRRGIDATRDVSRARARASRRCPSTAACSTARSWCSTTRRGRASACSSSARSCTRAPDIERAAVELPATLFVFDLLGFEGFDLRPLPLVGAQGAAAAAPARAPGRCASPTTSRSDGEALVREARASSGSRASSARSADSPYRGGRSADWLKVRLDRAGDFAVVGYTRPKGARAGLRRAAPGGARGRRPVYAGRVGTGFTREAARRRPRARSAQRSRPKPPLRGPAADGTRPRLGRAASSSCEVRYKEWTDEGLLRQPVFLRLRDDKRVEECVREERGASRGRRGRPQPRRPPTRRAAARERGRPVLQPRQGLLARRGLHQGRPHRLLPRDRAVAAALPARPAGRAHPLPRRHRRQVVLPEGRARRSRPAGCAPSASGASTPSARSTTSSATTSRRCSTSPTSARSRCTSGRAASRARAARLVHPRPRSQGRAVRARGRARAARSTRCATRSGCRASSRPAARPGCTC